MTIPKLPPGYSVRFADSGHNPIHNWEEFRGCCGEAILGLFFGKDLVGTGELRYMTARHGRRNVHTDRMEVRKKWRRRGHGLPLYIALIQTAKRLGADTIFSSRWLNKFSRKMWSVKLAALKTYDWDLLQLEYVMMRSIDQFIAARELNTKDQDLVLT
jgi:GNAT superfamily N-acetyltransferase